MNIVHIYIRRAQGGSLSVVRSTFPKSGVPSRVKSTVDAAEKSAWIEAQINDAEVRAIYACANCGVAKPDQCPTPWVDLPPGHPCERL